MAVALLVDDDPTLLRSLATALRKQPFDVVTAETVEDAWSVLDRGGVDVVVSDERMPGTPGSVFLTGVRRRHPDVQRIVLTGQADMTATIAAINEAHVFRFLTKPCSAPDLAEVIREAIQARLATMLQRSGDLDGLSVTAFEDALATLTIAYQPIVAAGTGRLVAYEALLRSPHPAFPTPPMLVDLATRLDRAAELDRLVRALVAADFPDAPPEASIFVNLIPSSLADPALLADDDPLRPWADRVVLEVTERAPLDSIEDVSARLAALRSLGYRIALDDLGAGYSGLTSFATLHPDIVKFDMELIRDIHLSSTRSKLVTSMVGLCNELGVAPLAEGVETDVELAHVVELGCELVQGYLVGRPARRFTMP